MSEYGEVTIERLERGLAVLAYLIERDGAVYAPLFEKLERSLDTMRRQQDTVARAKRLLETSTGRHPRLLAPPIDKPDEVFTAPRPSHRTRRQ